MPKVTLEGYIVVSDADLASVEAGLTEHIELTRKEEGCLVFNVSQGAENRNTFNVREEFVNRAAFETHQRRVKNSRWGQTTANVERHYHVSEDS